MRPLPRSGRICFISGLIALAALGCSQNLENNEQFQAQVSRLERMDEDLKNAMKTITGLENEFQQVLKEVGDLKNVAAGAPAGGGAPTDALKSLEQRLNALEAEMKKVTANRVAAAPAEPRAQAAEAEVPTDEFPAETKRSSAKARVQPSIKPSRRAVASVAVVGRSTTGKASSTATKATRAAAPAAKKAASSAPSGFYHEIGANDTVSSLAAKYNVSTDAIVKANQLPANFRLRIGQALFIPRSAGR